MTFPHPIIPILLIIAGGCNNMEVPPSIPTSLIRNSEMPRKIFIFHNLHDVWMYETRHRVILEFVK